MKIPNVQPFEIVPLPLDGERSPAESNAAKTTQGTQSLSTGNYGYYVYSTADIHVEDPPITQAKKQADAPMRPACDLAEVARHVHETGSLVIAIHGYSYSAKDTKNLYTGIYRYIMGQFTEVDPDGPDVEQAAANGIEDSDRIRSQINRNVFVGYRWPAEKRTRAPLKKLRYAFEALPPLLLGILIGTYAVGTIAASLLTQSLAIFGWLTLFILVTSAILLIVSRSFNLVFSGISAASIVAVGLLLYLFRSEKTLYVAILTLLVVASAFLGSIVITLILLRVINYSRDRYRASNYGTTDLVEFIRRLSLKIADLQEAESGENDPNTCNDIELSFIGHSLGCDVLTHAIRILSDVFDPAAQNQEPDPCLGQVFKLGQLVLVAPDIPVESILSGRANFLKSSLRRFKEAYVFSNEADLALRLASTAANYISFPARTRFRGYKLGNVTAKHFKNKSDRTGKPPTYGILNADGNGLEQGGLEIRSSAIDHLNLDELARLGGDRILPIDSDTTNQKFLSETDLLSVARSFTFFDCTDYVDTCIDYRTGEVSTERAGILSEALSKPALNFLDYLRLIFISGRSKKLASTEGHGGYFKGKLTQDLIYGLAFLGRDRFVQATEYRTFEEINGVAKDRQLQIILSSAFDG